MRQCYKHPLKKRNSLNRAKKIINLNIIKGSWKDDGSLKYELINSDTGTKLTEGDDVFMSPQEMVRSFVNDPEVIRIFHNDNWKEESAELRGREQGIELGREQKMLEVARDMLKENYTLEQISKITKLSTSKIKTLM